MISNMDTQEIEDLLCRDPIIYPIFGGVFPSDRLPHRKPPGKRLYVANTDPARLGGRHWVAFFFKTDGDCVYFDSYSMPPQIPSFVKFIKSNSVNLTFNKKCLQDALSVVCGHYCIFFAYHMARGKTLEQVINHFTNRLTFNDRLVKAFIVRIYKKNTKKRGGQCCRPNICI